MSFIKHINRGGFDGEDAGLRQTVAAAGGRPKALKGIDEALGSVSFDPGDPGSIEAAMAQIDAMIGENGAYASNAPIVPLAE